MYFLWAISPGQGIPKIVRKSEKLKEDYPTEQQLECMALPRCSCHISLKLWDCEAMHALVLMFPALATCSWQC